MNTIKFNIFKLVEWTNFKDKKIYLFVGTNKTHKEIIDKLLNSSTITSEEEDILKNSFTNYDILESTIRKNKDDNLTLIYENIYNNDTIVTLKQKISLYLYKSKINFDYIYLWYKKKVDHYEIIDILINILNKKTTLNNKEFNKLINNLFKKEINSNKKQFTLNDILNFIQINKLNTIYLPLELSYYDNFDNLELINSLPYTKKLELNENFVDEKGGYNPKLKYISNDISLLENKLLKNEINFTNVSNLLDSYDSSEEVIKILDKISEKDKNINRNDFLFNGLIKQYFPYLENKDIKNIHKNINEKQLELIKSQDNLINKVIDKQEKNNILRIDTEINKLNIKIYPNIENKEKTLYINLETLFNIFTTNDDIPFINYKQKNNNLFKINKKSLGKKNNSKDYKISQDDINNWTSIKINKDLESCEFKVILSNNSPDYSLYFTLIIYQNSQIDIIYNINEKYTINIKDIENSFILVNKLINIFNKELNINLINIDKEILYGKNVSFIEIKNFIISNNISFNKKIQEIKDISKNINNFYPYFDIIKDDKKFIEFRYKKIENYFNMDNIDKYIKKNLKREDESEVKEELIKNFPELLNEGNIDNIYNIKKSIIEKNIIKNKRFVKSKLNDGILVKMSKKNMYECKILSKGVQNYNYINFILNIIVILTLNNNIITKDIDKDKKKQDNFMNKLMKDKIEEMKNIESNVNTNSNNIEVFSNINNDKKNNNIEDFGDNDNIEDFGDNDEIENFGDDDEIENFGDNDEIENFEDNEEEEMDIYDKFGDDNSDNSDDKESEAEKDDRKIENISEKESKKETIDEIKNKAKEEIKDQKEYVKKILYKLQKLDKDLTGYHIDKNNRYKSYVTLCQAAQKKQPVVLTKDELEFINKNYRGSYTYYAKTGSTKEKANKNYYICPKIWCPYSNISLTDKDLKKNNGKCPEPIGEDPIILDHESWKNAKRYPYFLKKELHPNGFQMPCCGKKSKLEDEEKSLITEVFKNKSNTNTDSSRNKSLNNNDLTNVEEKEIKKKNYINQTNKKYIRKIGNNPVEPGKYAKLPDKLSYILGNADINYGLITDKTNLFVKKGVGIDNNKQHFISCMISLMNNDYLKDIDDFIDLVKNNMSLMDYIELNNGNTLKLYLNSDISIYDKNNFTKFKKWLSLDKNSEYVKKMNLQNLIKELNEIEEFTYRDDNISKSILREFMIYNSFNNYMYYLESNLVKNHEEVLQLFSNNYEWLNVNNYNIIILNVENNKDLEEIDILCSKFTDYKNSVNTLKNFVLVLKTGDFYEPIVNVRFKNSAIIEKNNFNYYEDNEIKKIVDYQKNNCNNINLSKYIDPIKLYNELIVNGEEIKHVVINMSFKIRGYVLNSNLYIPLDSEIFSTNILKKAEIDIDSYIYLQDIINIKCNLKLNKIQNLFKILNDSLNTIYYETDNSNIIENNKSLSNKNVALVLESGDIIPLNITNDYKDIVSDIINDEFIFLGESTPDDAKSYVDNYYVKDKEYNNKLKVIVNNLKKDLVLLKRLENLKNIYNPFPLNIKLNKVREIVSKKKIIENLIVSDNDINKISNDILNKNLDYIVRKNNKILKLGKDEIMMNQEDILENKLEKLYVIMENPYKYIENSIEDYVYYTPIQINKKLVKYNFITDIFLKIKPDKWQKLLNTYKINEAIVDTNTREQDTKKYFLSIFKAISNTSSKKYTLKQLEKYIDMQRKKDFEDDKMFFINEQKINSYFMNEYKTIISEKEGINEISTYNEIKEIFSNPEYKYSHYEIKLLSKLLSVNIILLGNDNKNKLPNGVRCFNNNSNKYILFQIINDNYDRYNIILKNNIKFILDMNDFSEDFKKYVIDRYCKNIEIDESSDSDSD